MQSQSHTANPFAFMMDPSAVIYAMEHSERLGQLRSRVCRPLDRPLIAVQAGDVVDFDHAVDADVVDVIDD